MKKQLLYIVFLLNSPFQVSAAIPELTEKQALGKRLFFDANLSQPRGMACASCHSPQSGHADPRQHLPVSEGANKGRFVPRNAPTINYLASIPALKYDKKEQVYIGGLFLDGRAASLEEQVSGPLFSANEMAMPGKEVLRQRLHELGYLPAFKQVYGEQALASDRLALTQLTQAIAAYERSYEFNPFTSKFDYYLKGKAKLTAQERRGWKIFDAEDKGNCAACHPSGLGDNGEPPLFTDFTYDNLGVPANPDNPFYRQDKRFNPLGRNYVDKGLGQTLNDSKQDGKFRVSTLRNIDKTAPYMHNGVFKTLREVIDFYNTRDVSKKWAPAEVAANVNKDEMGDLKLNEQEVEDLLAFLKTLSDGYSP